MSYDTLEDDAASVSESLQPIEKEVCIEATDETFLLRLRPYRRTDNRIDGCVITLVDITTRKRFEKQLAENNEVLQRQYAELENLYDTTPVGLCLLDREFRWVRVNERLAEINGFSAEEHIGKMQKELLPDLDKQIRDIQERVFETGEPALGIEVHGVTPAEPERERDWIADYYPVKKDGEVFAIGICVQEVTEQRALQQQVVRSLAQAKESEAKLRRLFDQAPAFIAMHEGPDHRYIYENDAHRTQTSGRVELGRSIAETFPELIGQGVIERFDKVYQEGKGEVVPAFQARLIDGSEGRGKDRWYSQFLQPWYDPDGNVGGVMSFAFDITKQVQAAENQNVLLHELQHRVKNTMATTLAIIQFSARRAKDVKSLTDTLRDRLQAIARTHDLLTSSEWSGGTVQDVIKRELAPYIDDDSDHVRLEGDDILLSASQLLSLALAIHELATNAAKYGALSTEHGSVNISVDRVAEDRCLIVWREEGGPSVEIPKGEEQGFGTFLLQRVLGPDLQGLVSIEYPYSGIECRIEFPLEPQQ